MSSDEGFRSYQLSLLPIQTGLLMDMRPEGEDTIHYRFVGFFIPYLY